jgi:hypothetical protein
MVALFSLRYLAATFYCHGQAFIIFVFCKTYSTSRWWFSKSYWSYTLCKQSLITMFNMLSFEQIALFSSSISSSLMHLYLCPWLHELFGGCDCLWKCKSIALVFTCLENCPAVTQTLCSVISLTWAEFSVLRTLFVCLNCFCFDIDLGSKIESFFNICGRHFFFSWQHK